MYGYSVSGPSIIVGICASCNEPARLNAFLWSQRLLAHDKLLRIILRLHCKKFNNNTTHFCRLFFTMTNSSLCSVTKFPLIRNQLRKYGNRISRSAISRNNNNKILSWSSRQAFQNKHSAQAFLRHAISEDCP